MDQYSLTDYSSFYSGDFTFSDSKLSCMREFYYVHITFSYLVGISGIACFITRLVQRFKWLHVWFGRTYMISMLWCCATSLLIHNTGLPIANIIQFAVALAGVSIGWILIKLHETIMNHTAFLQLDHKLKSGISKEDTLGDLIAKEKVIVANEKSFLARMFSYKAAHGTIMAISWANVAPRLFASNQSGDFSCYTYPAYKPIDTFRYSFAGKNLTIVPQNSPSYPKLPWANREALWVSAFFFVPLILSLLIGSVVAYFGAKKSQKETL
jgi:hypothetical protein